MSRPQARIQLLLADETGQPALPHGLAQAALTKDPALRKRSEYEHLGTLRANGDQNNLREQRWAVMMPEGHEDRLEALQPLIALRSEQQDADPIIFRVPRTSTNKALRFISEAYLPLREHEQPLYVTILADFSELPIDFEQAFRAASALSGRLHVGGTLGLRAYAEKVVAWESRHRRADEPGMDALFYTARDGTTATGDADHFLMKPGLREARTLKKDGHFRANLVELEYRADSGAADALVQSLSTGTRTAVFLSASHGLASRHWSSPEAQRTAQGVPVLRGESRLDLSAVERGSFLPGGAWFATSCLTGGSLGESVYAPWLRLLAEAGEPALTASTMDLVAGAAAVDGSAFVGAVPQAALRNPNGPLAVIAHVDLAWAYAFTYSRGAPSRVADARPQPIFHAIQALAHGERAGLALARIHAAQRLATLRFTEAVNAEIATHERTGGRVRISLEAGQARMQSVDLGGYVLFGDPAARLTVARPPGSA